MQSIRVRLMLVALLGVFAFGAVAAAAAQAEEAPFWSREGTRLAKGETHYITAKKYSTEFTMTAAGKVITCKNVRLKEGAALLGANAGEPGIGGGVLELFEGCTVTGNGSSCKPVEPIVTNNLKAELVETEKGEKGSLLAEFKPEKGTRLLTIKFEGTGCVVTQSQVEGEVAAQVLTDPNKAPELGELITLETVKKEAKSWLINFPATLIKSVWLIKGGVGSQVTLEPLVAFGEPTTIWGTALGLLAKKNSTGGFESEEVNWSPLP